MSARAMERLSIIVVAAAALYFGGRLILGV